MVIETDATPGKPALASGMMSPANLRAPLAFAISCFFIWGLAYGLLEVLNKHFQETLSISQADSAASPCSGGTASTASAARSCASSPRCTASNTIDCNGCSAARSTCRLGPRTPRAISPIRP